MSIVEHDWNLIIEISKNITLSAKEELFLNLIPIILVMILVFILIFYNNHKGD